mmetsp:Transcript_32933/g.60586  ORF Transcript_32933/g.60586 Transcript_32933/m.60586 type:complete len:231 (-) Transcript_32933:877-1569(-)
MAQHHYEQHFFLYLTPCLLVLAWISFSCDAPSSHLEKIVQGQREQEEHPRLHLKHPMSASFLAVRSYSAYRAPRQISQAAAWMQPQDHSFLPLPLQATRFPAEAKHPASGSCAVKMHISPSARAKDWTFSSVLETDCIFFWSGWTSFEGIPAAQGIYSAVWVKDWAVSCHLIFAHWLDSMCGCLPASSFLSGSSVSFCRRFFSVLDFESGWPSVSFHRPFSAQRQGLMPG